MSRRQNNPQTMGTSIGATGAGGQVPLSGNNHAFQVVNTDGGGDLAATVIIQVSNDGTNWITPALTISFTAAGTDGGLIEGGWAWARYNVTDVGAGDTLDIYCSTGAGAS